MKRITACLIAVLMLVGLLSGCNQGAGRAEATKIKIVSTIFPPYDWVREILGDKAENAELTLLLDNGVDLHSYQPTTDDLVQIASCDLFIYVGGASDVWVEDALKTATNKDMVVVNLMEVLGDAVKEEEFKEGMEHEHDEEEHDDHDHEDEDHDHDEEAELDEHVWLSLRHAQTLCTHIAEQLGKLDTENADAYLSNANTYNEKLSALDNEYKEVVTGGATKTLLFGDRFPFRYLVDDYGLDYYAAFSGCSAETEASFETIVFLAGKVDALKLKTVMTMETSDQSVARTIVQNTAEKTQNILVLDSLQSVTASGISSGTTYLGVMESNLDVLKEALN